MAKILIIEDDREVSDPVCDFLKTQKYTVEQAFDGVEGLDLLKFYTYDLVILDWELPGSSGPEICRHYRDHGGSAPILFLTGRREIEDKETGFDSGGDDYLTKPFNIKELSARVKALLRRTPQITASVLSFRNITVYCGKGKVTCDGKDLKLRRKEYDVLEFLMRNPGHAFSTEALLDRIWSSESDATAEAITTVVSRLRHKLDRDGCSSVITTVHGKGYRLGDP